MTSFYRQDTEQYSQVEEVPVETVCTECTDALARECKLALERAPGMAPTSLFLHFHQ